ncbi:related to interferon-induced GTP-binding protein Mx [Rhynchosporium agropyri]|uniref:Related to interferon-induced GTP-binding protein Mx n=1 Tax=Rhynchosporium agropyri TaxID=914238 RepID=A0A1E1K3D3_9HELO|nr:related to interferon-induced GTP-binding protein Mx [Rhynchosporium agropyri]
MGTFETAKLSALRSEEQLSLLDEIDKLRRSGISDHVSLPQIAVCGDQSSGKSSCLEAISGIPFPRKDALCTRFATELVLRKSPTESVVVNIYTLESFEELPALIEAAKVVLGLDKPGSGFSSDILRIEISGPTRPHLTIVDLPGLIHAKNDNEDDEDVEEVVSELVHSYMRRPRTIILAVVSALNDRALQAVLKRVKAVDPHGRRTMGLITKPDTLFKDSESEKDFVKLALNEVTHFRLGWHVLRNRDFNTRNVTSTERDRIEDDFFSQGVWKTLPRSILGVAKLRERLSKVLLDHIKSELPALIREIQDILDESQQALSRTRRFQAVVQNLNLAFAEKVRLDGQQINLRGNGLEGKSDEAISWVRDTLICSRGRELPGTFSPMLIGDLFRVQSKPWEKMSRTHLQDIWTRARKHVEDILSTLIDAEACTALLMHYVDPLMEALLKTANDEMDSLFLDRHRHAITYNHYFTENVQKIFNARNEKRLLEVLEAMFPIDGFNGSRRTGPKDLSVVCSMVSRTIPDMNTHASIELLDHLEAYYKVAMKTFVDNVAVQIIEASIVNNLANVFNPLAVAQMPSELVAKIAAESQENQTQRELLERKIDILKEGMDTCKRHASRQNLGIISEEPSSYSTDTPKSPSLSIDGSFVPSETNDFDLGPETQQEEGDFMLEQPVPVPILIPAEEIVFTSSKKSKKGKSKVMPKKTVHAEWPGEEV